MEEVDGIIAHTLRSIGCDVDEDVQSVSQFSTELVVEAVARCLKVINSDLDIPHKLPPSMSARFRVGTTLASAVQDLGYRGEVGYQTFLYSSEADIRRVFIFLIEKLPKEASEAVEESLGASALLQRAISAEIARRITHPWTPNYCKNKGICWRGTPPKWHREGYCQVNPFRSSLLSTPEGLSDLSAQIPKETLTYFNHHLPSVHLQPMSSKDFAASVLATNESQRAAEQEWETEWNTLGIYSRLSVEEYKAKKREKLLSRISDQLKQGVADAKASLGASQDLTQTLSAMSNRAAGAKSKGSRFTQIEKLQFAKEEEKTTSQIAPREADSEEDLQKKREAEITGMETELSTLSNQLDKLQTNAKSYTTRTKQMEEMISSIQLRQKDLEDAYKVKKKTLDLLPDAQTNIANLENVVEASVARVNSLAAQWEKHRAPLVDQYREVKQLCQSKLSETQKLLEEVKEMRERMKQLAAETRSKEEFHKQLVLEYERMTKDVNRSAYTRRILEIVSNIKKQKVAIDQILIDTRSIQKDINQLSGKLDRTFTVTDELIFKDAKKDEAVRTAYKYLAALHENCSQLMKTVEDTGVIMREIRDLEDQLEQESNKKTTDNLEKISGDLQMMRKENASLMDKYKKQHQGNK